jgi:hypothetical protein
MDCCPAIRVPSHFHDGLDGLRVVWYLASCPQTKRSGLFNYCSLPFRRIWSLLLVSGNSLLDDRLCADGPARSQRRGRGKHPKFQSAALGDISRTGSATRRARGFLADSGLYGIAEPARVEVSIYKTLIMPQKEGKAI